MEKYKKYLPSRKFTLIGSFIVVLAVIIFIIFFMASSGKNFKTGEQTDTPPLKVGNQSLIEMIQNDSDKDGIPDWEEALWGTDKNKKITFADTPDSTYIENKKKELREKEGVQVEEAKLTETEKFAREFFTSYSAMKSSGQVDGDAINNFSNALGQKIVDPNLVDRYSSADMKVSQDETLVAKQKYYETIQALFNSYQSAGLGDELEIVSIEVASGTASGMSDKDRQTKLSEIAGAYQDFGKKILGISAPASLAIHHLQIANSANNTGISVGNMTKIIEDPIIGLSGLSQYQKYSEDLVKSVADLEAALLNQ